MGGGENDKNKKCAEEGQRGGIQMRCVLKKQDRKKMCGAEEG